MQSSKESSFYVHARLLGKPREFAWNAEYRLYYGKRFYPKSGGPITFWQSDDLR